MSNNPGKKGKPAPWIQRERQDRDNALEAFLCEQLPDYKAWRERRREAGIRFRKMGEEKFPGILGISDALKYGDRRLREWDRKNPSPLTWEKKQELEAQFAKTYVPIDRS